MARFLPALTDQRYNRARIDEKNYRIEVYNREAKRWRGKGCSAEPPGTSSA